MVRVSGGFGVLLLAGFLIGLDPFLSAAPSAAPSMGNDSLPGMTVNHFRKGDRLPLSGSAQSGANSTVWREVPSRPLRAEEKVPVGCDPAFSPVTAPALAKVYGRCMT